MSDFDVSDALGLTGRDLVEEARRAGAAPVLFREDEVARLLAHLRRGRSVLLVGQPGAGKDAVLRAAAARVAGEEGEGPALRALATTDVMAGTRYLGEWQTKLGALARQAVEADAALVFTDVWNLPTAGRASDARATFLDALRPRVEADGLRLVGCVTPAQLREMERVEGFAALFERVEVRPLSPGQVDAVLEAAAGRAGLEVAPATRHALVVLTSRFQAQRHQPGPALRLLEQVADYASQKAGAGEPEPVTAAFVEKVFSIYSGLPRFVVSRTSTRPASEVRAWFRERLIGQEDAIDAVVETIALFKAGLHDPTRPIGTFLFVGPTGVGKTELARALARFLFGSEQRLLRFDLSELKDYHAFEQLLGSASDPLRPARLVDPVRAQPFQVILLDELEKAHPNVWDLLLQLLDEGRLTPPAGDTVSFRNTIVIATSNVGATEAARGVGFGGERDRDTRAAHFRRALEQSFRPELLNRFQHVAVFHPLSPEQLRAVARQELARVLARDGVTSRNLVVHVTDDALDHVIAHGVDPRYGARALKRELQRQLVLPLAVALMERAVPAGAMVTVGLEDGRVRVRVEETAESRKARRDELKARLPDGDRATRGELGERMATLRERLQRLAADVDEPFLRAERGRIDELRREPAFWDDARYAAQTMRDLDRIGTTLDRVERLRLDADETAAALSGSPTRSDLERVARRLAWLEDAADAARREEVLLGVAGRGDALVHVGPALGRASRLARDLVLRAYAEWAEWRGLALDWLHDPLRDDEPALLAVQGPWAYGYLRGETGLHRVRAGKESDVAEVRVAAWTDDEADVRFEARRALKETGQLGGRVRSRLACEGGLVLQNARTLAENQELARELAPSWARAAAVGAEVVRRYDLDPLRVRDTLLGTTSGRADALRAPRFHELLCARLDRAAQGRG